jgi:hypothetical protein
MVCPVFLSLETPMFRTSNSATIYIKYTPANPAFHSGARFRLPPESLAVKGSSLFCASISRGLKNNSLPESADFSILLLRPRFNRQNRLFWEYSSGAIVAAKPIPTDLIILSPE